MKKEIPSLKEIEALKELEELKHKSNMIELKTHHNNRIKEIELEKQSRIAVEVAIHDNKLSFMRLKRADEKMKARRDWA